MTRLCQTHNPAGMFWNKKLPGSSLLSTLFLSLILMITCSLLLLGVYYLRYFQVKDEINERLENDIQSVKTLLLADNEIRNPVYTDSFLLFNQQPDSGYYTKEIWGAYPLAHIKASYKGRQKELCFLYGASTYPFADATLYLSDQNRPLSLVGDTYIQGKAYLPKSGIRSGFFQQKGFSRKRLIEGETDSSKKQLPDVTATYKDHFKQYAQLINTSAKTTALTEDAQQSFTKNVQLYKTGSWGILNNRSLSGKIMVVSDSVIEIDNTSRLNNIILIAPFIHFKEGFKGSVQALALDSITVDAGCRLNYPSALIGLGRQGELGNTGSTITLHNNAVVEGIIASFKSEKKSNIHPVVKIKQGATAKGLVYCAGYVYLNGKVEGSIYTDFFFEQRGPLSMENILIDVSIVRSPYLLQGHPFSFFEGARDQKVISWLP
jgi:hypothetical protein